MITTFILGLSLLILICFALDIVAEKVKIPSVILLMGVGMVLHHSFNALHIEKAVQILPLLGTLALILIVIEAGFDLDYEPEKKTVILKAFLSATGNLLVCFVVLTTAFKNFYPDATWLQSMVQAIPFSIVSSAIAIPSAKPMDDGSKEFLTYETVFSDVLGIVLFNLFTTVKTLNPTIAITLTGSLIVSVAMSFVLSLVLVYLIKHSKHKIRFVPIFCGLVLIYAVGKYLHLPLLIAMMIFGLVMNNIEQIKIPHFKFKVDKELKTKITYFKRLTHELTFVLRGLFFTMFGYYLNLGNFLNPYLWVAVAVLALLVFGTRIALLSRLHASLSKGCHYIAPRGLISILLALSIPDHHMISGFHASFLDLFIIVTILIQLVARLHLGQTHEAESAPGKI